MCGCVRVRISMGLHIKSLSSAIGFEDAARKEV